MNIHISNEQEDYPVDAGVVEKIISAVLLFEGVEYDEVSLYFIDTETISDLHQTYFQDPSPTDCISFPMDDHSEEGYKILGDVFVCPAVGIAYAKTHNGSASEEINLYIVHGLLHLLGYDDISEEDKLVMREAERRHMLNLKNADLL
jgi:probable rRNA maturation factor